jgi:hypothetical protein
MIWYRVLVPVSTLGWTRKQETRALEALGRPYEVCDLHNRCMGGARQPSCRRGLCAGSPAEDHSRDVTNKGAAHWR